MSTHGGEMRAARDQADIGAGAGELYAEIQIFMASLRMWVTEMSADLRRRL